MIKMRSSFSAIGQMKMPTKLFAISGKMEITISTKRTLFALTSVQYKPVDLSRISRMNGKGWGAWTFLTSATMPS